ncbi:unnamed protein product, partial [Rotaria magnacalcarata]
MIRNSAGSYPQNYKSPVIVNFLNNWKQERSPMQQIPLHFYHGPSYHPQPQQRQRSQQHY